MAVWEPVPGDRRLVAYVVPADCASFSPDDLLAHLGRRLPGYSVPSSVVALEALPRNPNGKLDRKALPTPAMTSSGTRYAAPRTPTEEAIARCWSETLGAEEAGALDDFFKIGGHSLLAIRITVLMRVSFGIEIPIKLVFAERTVERVAAGIEAL